MLGYPLGNKILSVRTALFVTLEGLETESGKGGRHDWGNLEPLVGRLQTINGTWCVQSSNRKLDDVAVVLMQRNCNRRLVTHWTV